MNHLCSSWNRIQIDTLNTGDVHQKQENEAGHECTVKCEKLISLLTDNMLFGAGCSIIPI